MYIYKDEINKVDIYWEPTDISLGIDIVKEVTGKSSTEEKPALVTFEQKEEILRLYRERNNDPVEDEEENVPGNSLKVMEERQEMTEATLAELKQTIDIMLGVEIIE